MLFPSLDKIKELGILSPGERQLLCNFSSQATAVQCMFTSADRMKINYDENKSLGGGEVKSMSSIASV